ncbi:MAG: tRNA (adenosine(37)-N6)-threonylcarbamoyltransferase complex ATPase subunit type 1 TsaE [Phycisphaerae bacterium]|nr:tRNA (adenosine(37)-N6)-threonylcarbamoyltransferase complex ATPase subunit type 1 TsaE [Phycisphaerae bacterium]
MHSNGQELIYESESEAATRAFGRRLGQWAEPDTVVALIGPLGAGKTQLVKGLAAGLEVRDVRKVSSPTFVIIREHPGRLRLYHADAYRVTAADLSEIGFEEMCFAGGIVVVEWADRAEDILPDDCLRITIDPTGPEQRRLICRPTGDRSRRLLDRCAVEETPSETRP